jgi:hypothetical protein
MRELVKKSRRKIPRNALEPLMQTCEWISWETEMKPSEIFKYFLGLMSKYEDYFYSQPWPKNYDFEKATSFTDEDLDFLETENDFGERLTTVALKKNMYVQGFMGYFGMFWTRKAFHKQFIRPLYKPILEAFENLMQESSDAQTVVNKLKEDYDIQVIHDSLVDLFDYEYPDKPKRKLINEICEYLHTVEGLPSCRDATCKWYYKQKYPQTKTNNG